MPEPGVRYRSASDLAGRAEDPGRRHAAGSRGDEDGDQYHRAGCGEDRPHQRRPGRCSTRWTGSGGVRMIETNMPVQLLRDEIAGGDLNTVPGFLFFDHVAVAVKQGELEA